MCHEIHQQNHISDAQTATSNWLANILPPARTAESVESSASNTPTHSHVMSPMKPVNLLPDVPLNHNARKLTDKEQRDCDVIGKLHHKLSTQIQSLSNFYIVFQNASSNHIFTLYENLFKTQYRKRLCTFWSILLKIIFNLNW